MTIRPSAMTGIPGPQLGDPLTGPANAIVSTQPLQSILSGYEGSTVVITGGAGFIGSTLVRALSGVSCHLVLILRPGRQVSAASDSRADLRLISGSLGQRETWLQALTGADYLFHLAGQTSAYLAGRDPLADLEANVVPVLQMLEACRQEGMMPSVLFAGAVTQNGLPPRLPVNEGFPDLPVTVYDIHKLSAEKYLQFYAREARIPTVTLRLANVYGPGNDVGSADRGVLNRMVGNALRRKPLTVYGDGLHIRDYIFIEDVARAFLMAGAAARRLAGNYYVVGSGTGTRIVDAFKLVADRVACWTGFRPEVVHVPQPDGMSSIEERDFVADTTLFRSSTGWRPETPLSQGIDRTIDHLLREEGMRHGATGGSAEIRHQAQPVRPEGL